MAAPQLIGETKESHNDSNDTRPETAASRLIIEDCDLNTYPERNESYTDQEATAGDMHGSTLKMIWVLLKTGAIDRDKFTQDVYQQFKKLYEKNPETLSDAEMKQMRKLIKNVEAPKEQNSPSHMRFIGDTLRDRGQCDLWTLLLYQQFDQQDISFSETLSNHTIDFLYRTYHDNPPFLTGPSAKSSINLTKLMDKHPDLKGEVKDLVKKHVLPHIKLIDYALSLDDKTISLQCHAPIPDGTIKALANSLNIQYTASSAVTLAETIEAINRKFLERSLSDENYFADIYSDWDKLDNDYTNGETSGETIGVPSFTPTNDYCNRPRNDLTYEEAPAIAALCWSRKVKPPETKNWPKFVTSLTFGHIGDYQYLREDRNHSDAEQSLAPGPTFNNTDKANTAGQVTPNGITTMSGSVTIYTEQGWPLDAVLYWSKLNRYLNDDPKSGDTFPKNAVNAASQFKRIEARCNQLIESYVTDLSRDHPLYDPTTNILNDPTASFDDRVTVVRAIKEYNKLKKKSSFQYSENLKTKIKTKIKTKSKRSGSWWAINIALGFMVIATIALVVVSHGLATPVAVLAGATTGLTIARTHHSLFQSPSPQEKRREAFKSINKTIDGDPPSPANRSGDSKNSSPN